MLTKRDLNKLQRIEPSDLKVGDIIAIELQVDNRTEYAIYRICQEKDKYCILSSQGEVLVKYNSIQELSEIMIALFSNVHFYSSKGY